MKQKKLEVDRIREGTRMTTEKSFSLQKLHRKSCKVWLQNAPSGKCACGKAGKQARLKNFTCGSCQAKPNGEQIVFGCMSNNCKNYLCETCYWKLYTKPNWEKNAPKRKCLCGSDAKIWKAGFSSRCGVCHEKTIVGQ